MIVGMTMVLAMGSGLWAGPDASGRYQMDAPIPEQPPIESTIQFRDRKLGDPTTIYVNFDGLTLGSCNPSNSHENCHWYNDGIEFPPFSGTIQTQVAVLQAMRRDAANMGVRITGIRPPDDDDYTMVVYGGVEADFGALGSAPAGDCLDTRPNQIAFAHVDGELNDWINGGATTALHEAAHSWGLDHIATTGWIMFPSGDNSPTAFQPGCDQVVDNTDLDPGVASCPELNLSFCNDPNLQNAEGVLQMVFGPPYVDSGAPTLRLMEPEDGQYFQVPGDFTVMVEAQDDLHPQAYRTKIWLDGDPVPEDFKALVKLEWLVRDLPVGTYVFHILVQDEAGNEATLDFDVEVGVDPPPEGGGGCRVSTTSGVSGFGAWSWWLVTLVAFRRRRRYTLPS